MPLKLGSNLSSTRKRPLDKLIWRNSKNSLHTGRSYRSVSVRITVFIMLSTLFMFAGNRSARMYDLARKYTDNIMSRSITFSTIASTTRASQYESDYAPATIHDPESGEQSISDDSSNSSESNSAAEQGAENPETEAEPVGNAETEAEPVGNAENEAEPVGKAEAEAASAVEAQNEVQVPTEPEVNSDVVLETQNNPEKQDESSENLESADTASEIHSESIPESVKEVRGLETPPEGVYLEDAPLHAVNPTGKNFDINEIDNPTKVPRPEEGFPPRSLPKDHKNYELLRNLRAQTQLSPRWANHPELHLAALKSYGPAYASIIISDKLKVVYVPVFKVGTTSMMWNMAFLENNPAIVGKNISDAGVRDYILHDFNSKAWSNHAIYGLESDRIRATLNNPSYLKFGFVRNPYHRVVSAYLDKVVGWRIDSAEYQGQMYGLYGDDEGMRRFRNQTKPTFKEYLSAIEKVISSPRTKVQSLAHKDGYEDNFSRREIHFRPQVELLHPDLIQFDFIGRFDNIKNDTRKVLDWMYTHTDRRMPERKKMHSTDPKDKISIFERLREDEELRNTLIRIYKDDFEKFGFSKEVPDPIEHKD